MRLKLKEALLKYNNELKNGEEKMTQKKLASIIFPDKDIRNSHAYLNKLANGKTDHIRLSILGKICEVLNVDKNFILE